MIKLRPITLADTPALDELWKAYWSDVSLPGQKDKIIDSIAVDESDRIVGYGQVKMFAEAMLFLDPTTRKRDRARAVKLLMTEALRGVDRLNLDYIYCFIRDPDFSMLIQNRYGFKPADNPGELLVLSKFK